MEVVHSRDSKVRVAKEITEGLQSNQHKDNYEMLAWPLWLSFVFKNSIGGGK